MEFFVTETVARKLKEKHGVREHEVIECFNNLTTKFAFDTRDANQTNPPSLWFISETNSGRRLKVVFLRYDKTKVVLKTAFEPNDFEEKLYRSYVEKG